jgi:hypothetical protein
MMDRQQVINDSLVDRYLLGQLDESEAMAFEDFYAGSPETLAELEESALLIAGMREIGGGDIAGPLLAKSGAASAPRGAAARVRRIVGSPVYGIAASLVAVVALAVALGGIARQDGGITGPTRLADVNTPIVVLSPMRGGSDGLEIAVRDSHYVAMALDLGTPEAGEFRVTLLDEAGDLVWQADGLRPDAMDSLTFVLPAGLLDGDAYRLVARPSQDPGQTLTYPFVMSH